MLKTILWAFAGGFLVYIILAFGGWMAPAEAAMQAGLLAVWAVIIVATWLLVRGIWRLIRGVRPSNLARGAGALTSQVQRRTSGIAQAFKAGYKGDDSSR